MTVYQHYGVNIWLCDGQFPGSTFLSQKGYKILHICTYMEWTDMKDMLDGQTHMTSSSNIQRNRDRERERVSVCNKTTVTVRAIGSLVSCAYDPGSLSGQVCLV